MSFEAPLMPCVACRSDRAVYVIDTRPAPDGSVRRRRHCKACGHRWPTAEITRERYWESASKDAAVKLYTPPQVLTHFIEEGQTFAIDAYRYLGEGEHWTRDEW